MLKRAPWGPLEYANATFFAHRTALLDANLLHFSIMAAHTIGQIGGSPAHFDTHSASRQLCPTDRYA